MNVGKEHISKEEVVQCFNKYNENPQEHYLDIFLEKVVHYFSINSLKYFFRCNINNVVDITNTFRFNFWQIQKKFRNVYDFDTIYKISIDYTRAELNLEKLESNNVLKKEILNV